MKAYWWVSLALALAFLALFGVASALDISWLENPQPLFDQAGLAGAAALGIGLLVADVFLPVPASLVMVAHGAIFGIGTGAMLSLVGGTLAAAVGFAVGRRGGSALHRHVSDAERRRADTLLARWGDLAVLVTRPIPILAETVAILAGTSPISWRRFLLFAFLGNLPAAVLFAAAGATAARLENGLLVFALVLGLAAGVWLVGRRTGRRVEAQ